MPDLLPITLSEEIACVERELRLRLRVYPRFVSTKRMTKEKAEREIELMRSVVDRLKGLEGRK